MVDTVDQETAKGLRDRALLLFGFSGAFRRSELVALNTCNLEYRKEGVKVTIDVSKTDQEAQGQTIVIVRQPGSPYCPVQALEDWLTVSGNETSTLFRRMRRGDKIGAARLSAQSVAIIIKYYAKKVGLDSSQYSGHSLRRGFLTSAARNRANIFKMADNKYSIRYCGISSDISPTTPTRSETPVSEHPQPMNCQKCLPIRSRPIHITKASMN